VAAAVIVASLLLYRTLGRYSLEEIAASVRAIPTKRVAWAGAFAAASYLCLTGFDALALRYVGKALPYPRVMLASFTSLSLGHNIGLAALSSGAIRYRFYSRWGLTAGEVAKVILFCALTVGLGLATLGAAALLLRADLAMNVTGLPRQAVVSLGIGCLLVSLGYLSLACLVQKPVRLLGVTLAMPRLPLALAQLVVGPVNFACVAACLYNTLVAVADLPYLAVASAYVIANVTAIISHVPGGLGVIESVLTIMIPGEKLIGALIAFRCIYFFVPLLIGASLFAISEIVLGKRRAIQDPDIQSRRVPSRSTA
jgi:glycosyltransferase 2 family protein